MEYVETKLALLKGNLLDLAHIVTIQLQKSKQAHLNQDIELAMEVTHSMRRVNILTLQIAYDCKNILALYTPVAVDLRFILSSLKICQCLERIGSYSEVICKKTIKISKFLTQQHFIFFKSNEIFSLVIQMLYDLQDALFKNDSRLAEKVYREDPLVNEINRKATTTAIEWIEKKPKETKIILNYLEVINHVERIGDQAKAISEMIIFHQEAKVIKHQEKK